MRKAATALAAAVAFLLSFHVLAATTKTVNPASSASMFSKPSSVTIDGDTLSILSDAVDIPLSTSRGSVSVPVRTKALVPSSKILTGAKTLLKSNPVESGLLATVAIMLAAVDWVMEDGVLVKKADPASSDQKAVLGTGSTDYYWKMSGGTGAIGATPSDACVAVAASYGATFKSVSLVDAAAANCYTTAGYSRLVRYGSTCPSGTSYDSSRYGCFPVPASTTTTTPVTSSDIDGDTLDAYFDDQDATWKVKMGNEICGSDESCYKGLVSSKTLDGPTVVGLPTTTTTTTSSPSPSSSGSTSTGSDTSTTTQQKTGKLTITYNDNSISYEEDETTIITNPDGSTTTTDTPVAVPNFPEISISPWDNIPADIGSTTSTLSFLPYTPAFNMGGSCKEHTFKLPVVGDLTTNYCPIHETYVRPTLAFFFYVWTFIYIFQLANETVRMVRAH